MSKNVAVIICAAGESSRFGGKRKKAFVDVAGRGAFLRSLEIFADHKDVKQILLAIAPEDEELVTVKWGANLSFFGVKVCIGGKERFDTVNNALQLVKDDIELVAIHDAARCCLRTEWVEAVFTEAGKTAAAILACPVVATLKDVKDNTVFKTVDRTGLYEAQTPQVFETTLLKKAYETVNEPDKSRISDDSQLVEALGHKVSIVPTDSSNIKITHPADVAIAEAIIKSRPKLRPKGHIGPYAEAQW